MNKKKSSDIGNIKEVARDEDKHIILDQAIERLDNVLEYARGLHQQIIYDGRDDADNCESDTKRHTPSLEEILNNGTQRIDEYANAISSTLDDIRNALF